MKYMKLNIANMTIYNEKNKNVNITRIFNRYNIYKQTCIDVPTNTFIWNVDSGENSTNTNIDKQTSLDVHTNTFI